MLVHPKVEHHVEPLAVGEVVLVGARHDVCLAEEDCVSRPPLDDVSQLPQVLEPQLRCAALGLRLLEQKGDSIDTEARDTKPQPVADDSMDLLANARVLQV